MMSNSESQNGADHMLADIKESVKHVYIGAREFIFTEAESESERYIVKTLGLDPDSFTSKLIKDNYIDIFTSTVIQSL